MAHLHRRIRTEIAKAADERVAIEKKRADAKIAELQQEIEHLNADLTMHDVRCYRALPTAAC